MFKNKRIVKLLLVLVFSIIMGVCWKADLEASEPALPKIGTLKVAYVPHFGFSPFFIAKEKGYFSEQGLDVTLHRFRSGGHMLAPLSTGQLDVASGRVGTDLFNAFYQDMDIKIVAGGDYIDILFMVRKDLSDTGKIRKPADLKGCKMPAVSLRGLVEYVYAQVLAQGGLTIDDVTLITLPFHEIPTAFANRAIDAGATAYPMAAKILDTESAVKMPLDKTDTIQGLVMFFGKRLLDPANREISIRFMTAYVKALRDIQGEDWKKDEHVLIYSKYVKFPPALIKRCPSPSFPVNGEIDQDSILKQQAYHVGRGYTEFKKPFPLTRITEMLFLEKALERSGKIQMGK